jgi:hypothetical protein
MAHLLSDRSGLVPWFYPFKTYDFPTVDWHGILTLSNLAWTLLEMAIVATAVSAALLITSSLASWFRERRSARATNPGSHGGSSDI